MLERVLRDQNFQRAIREFEELTGEDVFLQEIEGRYEGVAIPIYAFKETEGCVLLLTENEDSYLIVKKEKPIDFFYPEIHLNDEIVFAIEKEGN